MQSTIKLNYNRLCALRGLFSLISHSGFGCFPLYLKSYYHKINTLQTLTNQAFTAIMSQNAVFSPRFLVKRRYLITFSTETQHYFPAHENWRNVGFF
jgi:hypothetical protein